MYVNSYVIVSNKVCHRHKQCSLVIRSKQEDKQSTEPVKSKEEREQEIIAAKRKEYEDR